MSGLLGYVVGGVADRLVPVLQTPVEDIIYEVLDQKGLPTRAEVRDLRNKLDRLEKTLGDLTASLSQLKEDASKAADDAERALEAAEAAPKAKAPAKAKAKTTKATKAKAKAPAKKAATKKAAVACKLDDCAKAVRAKGFCAAHYQRYKRGTLEGWVGADGTTLHENVRYRVGEDWVGQTVLTSYEGDEVLFLLPEDDGKSLRVKVNDARID